MLGKMKRLNPRNNEKIDRSEEWMKSIDVEHHLRGKKGNKKKKWMNAWNKRRKRKRGNEIKKINIWIETNKYEMENKINPKYQWIEKQRTRNQINEKTRKTTD